MRNISVIKQASVLKEGRLGLYGAWRWHRHREDIDESGESHIRDTIGSSESLGIHTSAKCRECGRGAVSVQAIGSLQRSVTYAMYP